MKGDQHNTLSLQNNHLGILITMLARTPSISEQSIIDYLLPQRLSEIYQLPLLTNTIKRDSEIRLTAQRNHSLHCLGTLRVINTSTISAACLYG